ARYDRGHDRARHGRGDGPLAAHPRARLRPADRRGHTRRGAAQPDRRTRLSRPGDDAMMDCLSRGEPLFFANQVVSGLAAGGIYALVALGLVLIFKSSNVVNFAQGDLLLVGAYIGWSLATA